VSEAAIGLVGAVIGGLLTAGSGWLAEWQRNRRQDRRDDTTEARALRQAVRLLSYELTASVGELSSALENQAWWSRAAYELPTTQWERYAGVISDSEKVNDVMWGVLSTAYLSIIDANARIAAREHRAREQRGPLSFTMEDDTFVLGARNTVEMAQIVLDDIAADRMRDDMRDYYWEQRRRWAPPTGDGDASDGS
jgi:hypothetical protein